MNEYRVRYVFGTHSVVVAVEGADDWDARRRGDIVLYDTFKVDAITAGETVVEFVRGI